MFDHSTARRLALPCAGWTLACLLAIGCGDRAATDPQIEAHGGHGPLASRAGAVGQQDAEVREQLLELRQATAQFHRPERAVEAGWNVRFPSKCLTHSDLGTMGFHLLNPDLVDGEVSVSEPELLVYEPGLDEKLRLVAVEYAVPVTEPRPDPLFGDTEFTLFTVEGVTVWQHHVWLWRHNPSGLFQNWNPKVDCDAADPGEVETFSD